MLRRPPKRARPERIPLDIPAVVTGGMFMRAKIRDLSTGGLYFECPNPPAPGALVTVRFTLPGESATIEMVGEVRYRKKGGAGLRAIRLPVPAREAIARFASAHHVPDF